MFTMGPMIPIRKTRETEELPAGTQDAVQVHKKLIIAESGVSALPNSKPPVTSHDLYI